MRGVNYQGTEAPHSEPDSQEPKSTGEERRAEVVDAPQTSEQEQHVNARYQGDPPLLLLPPAATQPPPFQGSLRACEIARQGIEDDNQQWNFNDTVDHLEPADEVITLGAYLRLTKSRDTTQEEVHAAARARQERILRNLEQEFRSVEYHQRYSQERYMVSIGNYNHALKELTKSEIDMKKQESMLQKTIEDLEIAKRKLERQRREMGLSEERH
jgi:hypothetical protein